MSGQFSHNQDWVYFSTKTPGFLPNKGCHICRESWVIQAASVGAVLLCHWMQRRWGCGHSTSLIASEGKEAVVEAPSGWFTSKLVFREQVCCLKAERVLCHAEGISFTLLGDISFLRWKRKLWAASRPPLRPYWPHNRGHLGKKWDEKVTQSWKQGQHNTY